MLASLKDEYRKKGVEFVSLTVDPDDTREAVDTFLDGSNATELTVGRVSGEAMSTLRRMAGIDQGVIPASVMISADGDVVGGHIGPPPDASAARDWINEIVP